MTLTDALTVLRDALPEKPALDDPHQAAVRVVAAAVPKFRGGIIRRPMGDEAGFPGQS